MDGFIGNDDFKLGGFIGDSGDLGAAGKTYSIQYRIYLLKTKSRFCYYIPHDTKMSVSSVYQTTFFGSKFEDQNLYLEFVKKTMGDQIKSAFIQNPTKAQVKHVAKFFETRETLKEIYGPVEPVISSSLVAAPVVKVTI